MNNLVELQDVFDYLGIDYADDMVTRRVTSLISLADGYLVSAVGENYMERLSASQLDKVKEISLMLIGDLYSTRGHSAKEEASARRLYQNLLLHMQIDYERNEGE